MDYAPRKIAVPKETNSCFCLSEMAGIFCRRTEKNQEPKVAVFVECPTAKST